MAGVKQQTLKAARTAKGWTQEQLEAETARLGQKVDQRNISKIERGGIVDPSNSTAAVLEQALDVERGTLVFGERRRVRERRRLPRQSSERREVATS